MDEKTKDSNPSFEAFTEQWGNTSRQTSALTADFIKRQQGLAEFPMSIDERAIKAFHNMAWQFAINPASVASAQLKLWTNLSRAWLNTASHLTGLTPPADNPQIKDRRFSHEAWEATPIFDYIKETYLLVSDWTQNLSDEARGLSDYDRKKVQFLSRQFASAISPSNFLLTNPEVLQKTFETGGENLLNGFKNLLKDIERGKGKLKISMTDNDAFKVGENIAVTPGKVVYRNRLFELIQYEPTTKDVYKTPILFVPPWINKFYVLDLKPENSLIKWVVDQGYTLFVISWVNPGPNEADVGFADYMKEGVLVALDQVLKATGEEKANLLGFCIGGILLTTTLAYLAAKGDKRVNSATLLATMINLTDAGEMSLFLDDEQLDTLNQKVTKRGYMASEEMSGMFNMMRENDLVWSFVVNNYLMGRDPVPFDLLYWNSDATRMPAKMIIEYLTGFYRDNAFMTPGRLTIDGHDIDVNEIETPVYMVATKDDHIAPWRSCYAGVTHFKGPKRFILGASGHIAGIVNPPHKNKYCYWARKSNRKINDPDKWFEGTEMITGSWWQDWEPWLAKKSGTKIPARKPEDSGLEILADAPGTYVAVRSD